MKGKNLQPRILYPKRLSFKFQEEIKIFTDKQKLRVKHHETSFTKNAKGNSLSGRGKATTGSIKITKGKISLVKTNIQ